MIEPWDRSGAGDFPRRAKRAPRENGTSGFEVDGNFSVRRERFEGAKETIGRRDIVSYLFSSLPPRRATASKIIGMRMAAYLKKDGFTVPHHEYEPDRCRIDGNNKYLFLRPKLDACKRHDLAPEGQEDGGRGQAEQRQRPQGRSLLRAEKARIRTRRCPHRIEYPALVPRLAKQDDPVLEPESRLVEFRRSWNIFGAGNDQLEGAHGEDDERADPVGALPPPQQQKIEHPVYEERKNCRLCKVYRR
jgi:hypothetical protein